MTLSYLEVVKVYTKAGGAYVVARENFGLDVAQIAAVSLLIDYTLTVAVSVAAGVAASRRSSPACTAVTRWRSPSVFVVLIAYGNLRGIREAGRIFAVPTYFFIANMVDPHRRRGGRRPSSVTSTPTRCTRRTPSRVGTPGQRAAARGHRCSSS